MQEKQLLDRYTQLKRSRGSPARVVPGLFAPDATVTLVGTGRVLKGHFQIESLYSEIRAWFVSAFESDTTISVIASPAASTVVEESIATFSHAEINSTFLPGVKPSYRTFSVPTTTITVFATIDGNLLVKSQRVYWDQASVLGQVNAVSRTPETLASVNFDPAKNVVPQLLADAAKENEQLLVVDVVVDEPVEPVEEIEMELNPTPTVAPQETEPTAAPVEMQDEYPIEHIQQQVEQQQQEVEQPVVAEEETLVTYDRNYKAHNNLPVTGSKISVKLYAPPGGRTSIALGGNYGSNEESNADIRRRRRLADQNSSIFGTQPSSESPVHKKKTRDFLSGLQGEQEHEEKEQGENERKIGNGNYHTTGTPVTGSKVTSVKLHAPPGGYTSIGNITGGGRQ